MVAWALLRGAAVNNETTWFCTLLQALAARDQRDIVSALLKRDVGSTTLLPKLPLWKDRRKLLRWFSKFCTDVYMQGGIYEALYKRLRQ
jgi:hypothetical protein